MARTWEFLKALLSYYTIKLRHWRWPYLGVSQSSPVTLYHQTKTLEVAHTWEFLKALLSYYTIKLRHWRWPYLGVSQSSPVTLYHQTKTLEVARTWEFLKALLSDQFHLLVVDVGDGPQHDASLRVPPDQHLGLTLPAAQEVGGGGAAREGLGETRGGNVSVFRLSRTSVCLVRGDVNFPFL